MTARRWGAGSPPPCALIRLALGFTVPSLRNLTRRHTSVATPSEINYRASTTARSIMARASESRRLRPGSEVADDEVEINVLRSLDPATRKSKFLPQRALSTKQTDTPRCLSLSLTLSLSLSLSLSR